MRSRPLLSLNCLRAGSVPLTADAQRAFLPAFPHGIAERAVIRGVVTGVSRNMGPGVPFASTWRPYFDYSVFCRESRPLFSVSLSRATTK